MQGGSIRNDLERLFRAGVEAARPGRTLPDHLPKGRPRGRTIVLGAGKASGDMARVAHQRLEGQVTGLVVTRYGHRPANPAGAVAIVEAGHPVPDQNGVDAARAIRQLAKSATAEDRVLFLMSGGGSALLCEPIAGLSLDEKIDISRRLVRSGLPIEDINLVRRHLSTVKGGRLAEAACLANLHTFVISDVVGDDPAIVASGPSVASAHAPEQVLDVLARAQIHLRADLIDAIRNRASPVVPPHPVITIATNQTALDAIAQHARDEGWNVVSRPAVVGEAASIGREHGEWAREFAAKPGRHLLLSGGELTVTVGGAEGSGGPNLEYLAGLMTELSLMSRWRRSLATAMESTEPKTTRAGMSMVRGETACTRPIWNGRSSSTERIRCFKRWAGW